MSEHDISKVSDKGTPSFQTSSKTASSFSSRSHTTAFLNPAMAAVGSSPFTDIHVMAAMQRPWNSRTSGTDAPGKVEEEHTRPAAHFARIPSEGSPNSVNSAPHRGMDGASSLPPRRPSSDSVRKENVKIQSRSARSNGDEARK